MTTRRTPGTLIFAFASAATLLFAPILAAQRTAEEQQVVFRVRIVQTELGATDKLEAERVANSRMDFRATDRINVHVLNETTDIQSLLSSEAARGS